MDAVRFVGFLLIAISVVIGLDYYQQDKKHEGLLSLSGYLDTVNDRFNVYQTERVAKQAESDRKDRWKAGTKSFLPTATESWVRHELSDEQTAPVTNVLTQFAPTPLISSISTPQELAALRSSGREGLVRKLAETGAVYSSEGQTFWLDISLKPKSARNSLANLALGRQAAFLNAMSVKQGFAVIDGVGFVEVLENAAIQNSNREYRSIEGRIGFDEEVVIRLQTRADDTAIRDILERIDYAGLNELLAYPSPVVGAGIFVPDDQQPEMASKMDDLYGQMQRMQDKVSAEKIQNMDMTALMVNTLTASGFNSDGLMDVTGGKVFENQQVMQIGYGRAQELLLTSDQRQASAEPKSEGRGLLGRLMAKLPAVGSGTVETAQKAPVQETPAPREVRVHKGGGIKPCAQVGSIKRCSVGGN